MDLFREYVHDKYNGVTDEKILETLNPESNEGDS